MREQIAVDGFMLPGSRGQLHPHPLLTHMRALETQMTHWESAWGFTPSARAQLGHAEVARVSKLDELMAKRAQRGGSAWVGLRVGRRVVDAGAGAA